MLNVILESIKITIRLLQTVAFLYPIYYWTENVEIYETKDLPIFMVYGFLVSLFLQLFYFLTTKIQKQI